MSERRGGMRAIGTELSRIAGPTLGKRGFAEAQLIAEWAAIVGADLAEHCSPDKLSFPRGERREGTLQLSAAAGFAPELQHREPLILERINAFFGYRAVGRLRLTQRPPSLKARRRPPPSPRPLSATQNRELEKSLAAIPEGDLREALDRLGRAVLGKRD